MNMKKILSILSLLGICLLVCIGCAKDVLDTTGNISGVITDAETGNALSGVTVTLSPSGKSFTTGNDGRYEFRDITLGNYTVQATKSGYAQNQKNVEVVAGETSSLDIPLSPSAPKMELSTTTLDFGTTATTLTLDIRNTGSAALTWQVSEDIQWLNCLPLSGTTAIGQSSSVIVNVDRTGLSIGTHTQTIAISSNGGSQTVRVSMSVQEENISISVSPEALDFGSTSSSLQLTLTNTDTSRSLVAYTLTAANDWVHLSKTQGQLTYNDVITVSVDRASLSEGSYTSHITVTSEGKTKVVPVTMTIAAKTKPTVNITEVNDVTYNTATFSGAIVTIGSSRVTHHGFVWGTAEQPTKENGQKCDLGDAQTAKNISYKASNLQSSTTYYVRAYAENDEGISYSSQQLRFTTSNAPSTPTVETGTASGVQQKQATVTGNITDIGVNTGVTAYGHVWNTQPTPTIANHKTNLGQSTENKVFTSTLTNLQHSTTYYVRAYATNAIGTAYGQEIVFTTPEGVSVPTLSATTISNIKSNEVTATSAVTNNGNGTITEVGFCYGTSAAPTVSGQKVSCGAQNRDFTGELTGLSPSTTYYVRSYATNEEGTAYGAETTFTTQADMIARGLLAYYTFDEGNCDNTISDNYHGFLNGGTYISDAPNGSGKALSLNSEEYVSIADNVVGESTSWSVSMWVKDFGKGPLFVTNNNNTDIGRPSFGVSDDGMFCYKTNFLLTNTNFESMMPIVSLTSYMSGVWTMLTLTYNGSSCTLFINGHKVDTRSHNSGYLKGYGVSMVIGGKSLSYTHNPNKYAYMTSWPDRMKIDDVRIHNVALTDAEVAQIYEYEK